MTTEQKHTASVEVEPIKAPTPTERILAPLEWADWSREVF